MKTPLQNLFEIQVKALTGFNFQDFVVKVFQYKYGETAFTDIRPQKDKGNDGIIETEKRVIACYGPEETQNTSKRQKDFAKKAKADYLQYQLHWEMNYPNWSIVINHKIDPNYDSIVKKMSTKATVIGISQLLVIIDNLKNYQRRKLGLYLNIGKEYLASEYLQHFLDDLLNETTTPSSNIKYDLKSHVSLSLKFKLNFNDNDLSEANIEYEHLAESGGLKNVENLFSAYDDEEIDKMKNRIIYDFCHLTKGKFKHRLQQLTEHYLTRYSVDKDDDYLYLIRAVLIYLFEQCLLGNKIEKEKDNDFTTS